MPSNQDLKALHWSGRGGQSLGPRARLPLDPIPASAFKSHVTRVSASALQNGDKDSSTADLFSSNFSEAPEPRRKDHLSALLEAFPSYSVRPAAYAVCPTLGKAWKSVDATLSRGNPDRALWVSV